MATFTNKVWFQKAQVIDGQWYCACGLQVTRLTANTALNPGRRFLRCPKDREEQCDFFLWGDQEPTAKALKSSQQIPPLPYTPTNRDPSRDNSRSPQPSGQPINPKPILNPSTPNRHARAKTYGGDLPTPPTDRSLFASNERDSRPVVRHPRDTSPTPSRPSGVGLTSDADTDLATAILKLFSPYNIEIKKSTEYHLRRIVNQRLEAYEFKLQQSEDTICDLVEQLGDFAICPA